MKQQAALWAIVFNFAGKKHGVQRRGSGAEETDEAGRSQHVPRF